MNIQLHIGEYIALIVGSNAFSCETVNWVYFSLAVELFWFCSEPEVQILDQLSKEFKPHIWVNVHSGMKALFMPYDHMASLPNDENGKLSLNLLQQLNALKCEGQCVVGSGGKSVGKSFGLFLLE